MLFHYYLALCRLYYTFCSNSEAVPPSPPIRTWWGGTNPEASTENPEASVQRLGGGGPIQRHQKIWNDNPDGSGGKTNVLLHGESFGTIFRSLRLTWRPRTGWRGWRRSRSTSRSEILSQLLRHDSVGKTNVLGHGESFGTIFRSFRSTFKAKNWVVGL